MDEAGRIRADRSNVGGPNPQTKSDFRSRVSMDDFASASFFEQGAQDHWPTLPSDTLGDSLFATGMSSFEETKPLGRALSRSRPHESHQGSRRSPGKADYPHSEKVDTKDSSAQDLFRCGHLLLPVPHPDPIREPLVLHHEGREDTWATCRASMSSLGTFSGH